MNSKKLICFDEINEINEASEWINRLLLPINRKCTEADILYSVLSVYLN